VHKYEKLGPLGTEAVIINKYPHYIFCCFFIEYSLCPCWLSGDLKATCVCFIVDFYNIKTLLVHKGFSGVMIKASITDKVLRNYKKTCTSTCTFTFKCTYFNTVSSESSLDLDVRRAQQSYFGDEIVTYGLCISSRTSLACCNIVRVSSALRSKARATV
jgi:hypothetical protein